MKGVVIAAVLIGFVLFLGSMFLSGQVTRDPGHMLAIAFGVPTGDAMQFHLAVGPRLPLMDPPELSDKPPDWTKWAADHFQLRDDAGNQLPLKKMGTSGLMLDDKASGSPEFVLWADVKKGRTYSCDYVPIVREGKRYRYTFTVPSEPAKTGRCQFDIVIDEES